MAKKNALGRGLGALIEDAPSSSKQEELIDKTDLINEIPVKDVESNPFQPRSEFDEESLNELTESIKQLGLIQPITVRKLDDNKYQLISGERRLKASKLAGLKKVPAYVRIADDQNMLEMALVENIQREDLNSIEVAISFQRLIEECKLTQENLSERVGKKRSTISNYLRLLKLPGEIQLGIRERLISMGHARALINMEDNTSQIKVYNRILKNELSVRKTEEMVRSFSEKTSEKEEKANDENVQVTGEVKAFQDNLNNIFKKVDFKRSGKGNGKIVISYNSDEELNRIIAIFETLKIEQQ